MTTVSLPVLTPTPARPQRVLRLRVSERAGLPFMVACGVRDRLDALRNHPTAWGRDASGTCRFRPFTIFPPSTHVPPAVSADFTVCESTLGRDGSGSRPSPTRTGIALLAPAVRVDGGVSIWEMRTS